MVHIIFKCFSDIWKLDIWDHCFYSLSIHCNSEGQIYLFKYILYNLCLLIFVLLYVIQVLVWMLTKMYVMLRVLVFVYFFIFFYYMFYVFYFENKKQTPYLMETYFSLITGLFYFFWKMFHSVYSNHAFSLLQFLSDLTYPLSALPFRFLSL